MTEFFFAMYDHSYALMKKNEDEEHFEGVKHLQQCCLWP